MLLAFYSAALFFVLVLALPYWLLRMIASGKYRAGLAERMGRVPGLLSARAGQSVVWVHAVSVGEVMASSRLLQELAEHAPEFPLVLSTTTRSGQKLAEQRMGREHTFYFPLDFAWVIRRYLKRLNPALLVLVESELWPNVLAECRKRAIPVAVVNGRVSDRSFPRYLRLRRLWRRIVIGITIVLAQSEEDARRFRAIGVPAERVRVVGNLKCDVRAVKATAVAPVIRAHLPARARVLVCGSTADGEDEILLDIFRKLKETVPELILILAPRHPERFDRVAQLIQRSGIEYVRRSRWMEAPSALKPGSVILLDSIGELASVYSLSSVAFIGKSLHIVGGQNPLEAAQFGVPIVMGPHYENFREIVNQMLEHGAIKLATEETLAATLLSLLQDVDGANLLGVRALEVFESQAGATEKSLEALLRLLPRKGIQEQNLQGKTTRSAG